jgi:sigma-B regulation protein RsbU (phosphoserine phosphatase)
MYVTAAEVSSAEVIAAFQRDAPYLFLGAALVAVGVVAAAFSLVRRKFDLLLIDFALFAVIYGARLWLQSGVLELSLPHTVFLSRLRVALDYVILIPAVLFFNSLWVPKWFDRIITYAVTTFGAGLAAATFITGPSPAYRLVNNVVVIAILIVLFVRFTYAKQRDRSSSAQADYVVIRGGLVVFIVFALWDNLSGVLSISSPRTEPFAFVIFLGSLGYVAARRTLQREQQLNQIQKELEVARHIQQSILPAQFPSSTHFQVAARYVPMASVAGDFYDYVVAEDRQAGLLVADVSGHGVPAALIASMVKLAAASQRKIATDPSQFLSAMNTVLLGNTQNQFVTAAYVHLNSDSGELRYSAAAHPPMLLLRNDRVIEIEENGPMLAAFDFAAYSNVTHQLKSGDRFLLYTDGVVEASNTSGEFLGHEAFRRQARPTLSCRRCNDGRSSRTMI